MVKYYGLSKRDFINLRTTATDQDAFVVVDIVATVTKTVKLKIRTQKYP
jgi:hypothetical protein